MIAGGAVAAAVASAFGAVATRRGPRLRGRVASCCSPPGRRCWPSRAAACPKRHRPCGPRRHGGRGARGGDRDSGRVKLGGEVWTARNAAGGYPLEVGSQVRSSGSTAPRPSSPRIPRATLGGAVHRRAPSRASRNVLECDNGSIIALIVLAVLVLFVVSPSPGPCASCRRRRAVIIERLGRYSRTLEPGLHFLVPFVDRPRAERRPARAGRVVPAAAGDHVRQPRGQHRHGDLLPADRPEVGGRTRSPTTSRASSS